MQEPALWHEPKDPQAILVRELSTIMKKLGETPEARILAGTANALADIAGTPAELERQRGAVIAGLQAIDRLMPKLHTFSLAAGSMELDNLLHTANGMGTADVRRALGMQ